jgi:hypothetical protein
MELIISNFGRETRKKAPTGWNDLSLRDAMLVMHIMSTVPRNADHEAQILQIQRLQIARTLLNIQDHDLETWEADCLRVHGKEDGPAVFAEELSQLMSVADAFYDITTNPDTGAVTYAPRLALTKCPYPAIEYGQPLATDRRGKSKGPVQRKRLFAPADGWDNISFYEMCELFTCVEQWAETGDEEHVTRALATLYREPKPDTPENKQSGYHGDRRRPLLHEENMVERRMRHLAKLPAEVRDLLWYWCRSCRQSLINRYKRVFAASDGTPDALSEAYGWGGVLMELAGGVVALDTVSAQNATTVLTYLSYLEDKALLEKLRP